ncbi:hypothetical protein [Pigmentiphaga kullae]|uniref:Uncharacterized protein n=1 Tax=Pigmentiphaga kullae TaxID=151784 RepID=A0A4Q7NM15_9BURK|nr:hypothetical protein [Pigmentiphaga kullae]RZS86042.1 hypothetical protein EV675_2076 [Pigmentiphaga kullae]
MSGRIQITQGPTLANPDAIQDERELRAELDRLNETCLQATALLHEMTVIARRQADLISGLIDMYESGDATGLSRQLRHLAGHRLQQLQIGKPVAH